MTTLEEAVALGRGVERPFRCHEHEDTSASASVNVVKGVWYCYACFARGVVDGTRIPSTAELQAMLEPEAAGREYAEAWLTVYGVGGYWADRFPMWLCWLMGLGEDPWTGDGVFPVHTPRGRLAGLGRRFALSGPGPKYKYPPTWSASRALFGSRGIWKPEELLVLVEGAADACAVREAGIPAYACYGAGIHQPQVELVAAMSPRLILLGFDIDEAGERATGLTADALQHLAPLGHVRWDGEGDYKDPADAPPEARLYAVISAAVKAGYSPWRDIEGWAREFARVAQEHYLRETRV